MVTFKNPPKVVKTNNRVTKFMPDIEELRDNPGVWGLVMENVSPASSRVLRQHGLKTVTRTEDNCDAKRVNVYAVYDPDDTASASPGDDEVEATEAPAKRPKAKKAAAKKPRIK